MEEKLVQFYNNCILPELLDPRHIKKMEIRDPDCIIQAKRQKMESKSTDSSENGDNFVEGEMPEKAINGEKNDEFARNLELRKQNAAILQSKPCTENDLWKSAVILFNKNTQYPLGFPEIDKTINGINVSRQRLYVIATLRKYGPVCD